MFPHAFRAAALSFLVAAPAFAQTIDQQQTSGGLGRYVNYGTGESFKPTMNQSLGAGVLVKASYGLDYTTVMDISLWGGGLPNNGGTLLATASTTLFLPAVQTLWVDAFWSAPVDLTVGDTYFLTFIDSHDQGNAYKAEFQHTSSNVYNDGDLLYVYQSTNPNDPYQSFNGYDLAFREYGANVETTPEPASLVLMATGLVGVMVVRRRKRK